MKIRISFPRGGQKGSGLLLTLFLTLVIIITLAGALSWSAGTFQLNERMNQYNRSVAAAEAATETVLASMMRDFDRGGSKLVTANKDSYKNIVPTNSGQWTGWEFSNATGNTGKTYVTVGTFDNYELISGSYAGLMAWVCPVAIISNARFTSTLMSNAIGAVGQSLQLANIPIFQFAMFSSGDMEVSCGQPFKVTGKVHANGNIYVEPDSELTFLSDVKASGEVYFPRRHPDDDRSAPVGTVQYPPQMPRAGVGQLTMPIGVDNTPLNVRGIIDPPPSGESATSLMGAERYYNKADLIITVSSLGIVTAKTGVPFGTPVKNVTNTKLTKFAYINTSFTDLREGKLVRPLEIDVGELKSWSDKSFFGNRDVSSIYIDDKRVLPSTELAAVRVRNGLNLPPNGLTVATARPLYVLGHYNQNDSSKLGTADTSTTLPASFVADAITILSKDWADSDSAKALDQRVAASTTVNAAFLTGVVETTGGQYSGGMENFPRFLERWGSSAIFTYNGSMVKMFPSHYATGQWGVVGNAYEPPARNWAYDVNFNKSEKLPPLTPCVQKVNRLQWTTVAPKTTTIPVAGL